MPRSNKIQKLPECSAITTTHKLISTSLVLLLVLSFLHNSCAGTFDLSLSAELDNVQRIGLPADHTFFLRLRCANCHEEPSRAVAVSHAMEVNGVRGSFFSGVQVIQRPPLQILGTVMHFPIFPPIFPPGLVGISWVMLMLQRGRWFDDSIDEGCATKAAPQTRHAHTSARLADRPPLTRLGDRPSSHPPQVRCKGCERVNDVSLLAPSKSAVAAGAAGEYVADGGEWQPVASFECRGVEPVLRGGAAF